MKQSKIGNRKEKSVKIDVRFRRREAQTRKWSRRRLPPDCAGPRAGGGAFLFAPSSLLGSCCLALVFAGWIGQPVLAQASPDSHPRKWEFSVLAGAGFLSGKTFGPVGSDSGSTLESLDYNGGYSFGFGVIENLGERFGAEMRYGIGSLPLGSGNLTAESPAPERSHYVHGIVYSLLIYPQGWKRGRLVPYAVAGIGASLFQPSNDPESPAQTVSLENRWKLAGEVGAGVKLHLDRPWGLRFEVRDRITGVPGYGLPRAASQGEGAGSALTASGQLHHWQFHVGVSYNFDR